MPIANAQVLLDPFTPIDAALRRLKKAMQNNGSFLEIKKREYYEKPSERKRRKSALARKKARSALKKKHISNRDGVYELKPNHTRDGEFIHSPPRSHSKMTTTVTDLRTLANAEDLAGFLFEDPGPMNVPIVLEGNTSTTSEQRFFRLRQNEWREIGAFPIGQEPRLRDVSKLVAAWRVRMCPYLSAAMDTNAMTRLDCLWCYYTPKRMAPETYAAGTFNVQRQLQVASAQLTNQETIDPDRITEAISKIGALSVIPNVIVNEGDRLALIWKLSKPFTEDALHAFQWERSRAVWTMNRLAARLGQSASTLRETVRSAPATKQSVAGDETNSLISKNAACSGVAGEKALETTQGTKTTRTPVPVSRRQPVPVAVEDAPAPKPRPVRTPVS